MRKKIINTASLLSTIVVRILPYNLIKPICGTNKCSIQLRNELNSGN